MRYLITGVAGFIGAHLAVDLLQAGHEVLGIDTVEGGYSASLKWHRINRIKDAAAISRGAFRHVLADVAKLHPLAFGAGEFDAVIHLAGRAGVRQSVERPREYLTENIGGMIAVLELLRAEAAGKLIYASSSSVYTPSLIVDRPEHIDGWQMAVGTHDNTPRTPYAASKRILEMMADAYREAYDVHGVGLRFFSVYGPAGRPDSRASVFQYVRQVLEGERVTIYGHSEQKRDFTFVGDVVREIRELLTEPTYHAVLNVGAGEPRRVRDVIGLVERLTGKTAQIQYRSDPRTDTALTYSTPLPFTPTPLEEGVQACIDWYLANRDWARLIGPESATEEVRA